MDPIRFGRIVRALRRRHGWRQVDLAARAGVSQSLVARIERGGATTVTPATLERILTGLGARLVMRIDWQGEAADRLLDAEHAALVDLVIRELRRLGWEAEPEVTFAIGRERGSIDVFAWHAASSTLLIVEVKSVVPDVQGTLMPVDRKVRLGPTVAAQRGWQPRQVAQLLVIREDRTARRRVAEHAATFDARFPDRIAAIRRFLSDPAGRRPLRGLWFLTGRTQATPRHRVATRRRAA